MKCYMTSIYLSSNSVCLILSLLYAGYINHEEENAKFFNDKDGFVHTGDLGYYDQAGVLFYHGRKKELIKYQNCHISPTEIEEVAMQHPEIEELEFMESLMKKFKNLSRLLL